MKKLVIMVGILGTLTGCEINNQKSTSASIPTSLPDASVIRAVAVRSYQVLKHRDPTDLSVGDAQHAQVFYGHPSDYLVCVSTTEKTIGNKYDSSWNLISPIGTPFRQSYVMHMRYYQSNNKTNNRWGSGVFRRIEEEKIGRIKLRGVCPPSQH